MFPKWQVKAASLSTGYLQSAPKQTKLEGIHLAQQKKKKVSAI